MEKNKYLSIFKEGVLTNNPTFVQLLGMCPTLATTTSISNAVGMGAAVIVVLMCSNLFISLVRKLIPKEVRIASYIVIISGFVTAVELLIKAFFPAIDAALGLFIPLIVVNCIILARAEAFASKNAPLPSVIDGLATGIGFTAALVCIAAVRELLGTGMLFAASDGTGGIRIFGEWFTPVTVFLLPAGAFLTLGFLIALVQKITATGIERKRIHELELDALDAGYHKTLMRDPETGKIVKKADILTVGMDPEDPREENKKDDAEFLDDAAKDKKDTKGENV
ncbi:MAG: electron transport complex subunit E [Clostridia bacterium]|nr:electron transport complex subunit E [Clostridia bacterium]